MAYYLLYFLTVSVVICGTGMFTLCYEKNMRMQSSSDSSTALYLTRSRWLPFLPGTHYLYHRLPSSFARDLEAGLTSSQFDISANVADGDTREGLDERAKHEIQRIMASQKVSFDEARRIYTQKHFAKHNIGPDGRPRDPRFVSFS